MLWEAVRKRKIVAPGVHKTGLDRFDDADREIQLLTANQDVMDDCLEEMLGIFRGLSGFREDEDEETDMSHEMGLLEDNPQDARDSSTAVTPPESPLTASDCLMHESLESVSSQTVSIDQDRRRGAAARRMPRLRLVSATGVRNSQVDAHAGCASTAVAKCTAMAAALALVPAQVAIDPPLPHVAARHQADASPCVRACVRACMCVGICIWCAYVRLSMLPHRLPCFLLEH
jgi:hypothetical protein